MKAYTLLFAIIFAINIAYAQQPGDLDPTFGDGGRVITFIETSSWANSVAIQSDGKVVAAGNSIYQSQEICGYDEDGNPYYCQYTYFVLARYNPGGSLDTSFGTGGAVVAPVAPEGSSIYANAVAIQADGKIVAAGDSGHNGYPALALVRYNSDGSPDASFGTGGRVVIADLGPDGIAYSVAIQSDGKIVAAGKTGSQDFALIRFNPDGSLDTTFDGDGKVITDLGTGSARAHSVKIQSDGKIVTAGDIESYNGSDYDYAFVLVRYDADGSLDTTFDGDGKVITSIGTTTGNSFVNSAAIQSDGKIVAAGTRRSDATDSGDFIIVRYNTNGSLDTTFDGDGKVITNMGPTDYCNSVAIQSDGKIVAAGFSWNGLNYDFALARYSTNGSLDNSFGGGDGISTVDFNNSTDYARGMALDGQGRAVVVGQSGNPSSPDQFELARVLLDTSTTTITVTNTNDSGPGSLRQAIADAAPGGTINFDATVFAMPQTIALTSGQLMIDKNLTIQGLGTNQLSISGNGGSRVFYILSNVTAAIDGITISGGRAPSIDAQGIHAYGGGIANEGTLTLSNSTVSGNSAYLSCFEDCTLSVKGGGIYNQGTLTVTNSTVSGNSAWIDCYHVCYLDARGGGIESVGILILSDSTVSENIVGASCQPSDCSLSDFGGGIAGSGTETLVNTIVASNPAVYVGFGSVGADISSDIETASHNLIGDAASSGGIQNGVNGNIVGANPMLRPLRNNGGPTMTHALLPGSPAINAGDNCVLVENGCGFSHPALSTDQRGMPRNGTVDIGAFERQANEVSSSAPFDFDGDGKTDIGITRPNGGIKEWWLSRSSDSSVFSTVFGVGSDISAPADFTGDGKTDITVFRPASGQWFILRSEDFSFLAFPFGANGDIPMPADYDGDGKADPAVFRPSAATWFINRSSDNQTTIAQFGAAGNQPVAADYDGDGKADIAIYRLNNGVEEWWIQRSTSGLFSTVFGAAGDKAVPGDYTGDGKTDIAVWRPSNGNWFILRSEDLSYLAFPWGANGDIPAPGDYDGDGKTEAAVFRPSSATWYINRTGGSGPLITNFGSQTDSPVPGAFVR